MIKLPYPPQLTDVTQNQTWFARLWQRVTKDLNNKEWTSWTPTLSNDASMTISAEDIVSAEYAAFGEVVFFNLVATFTTGGVADTEVNITLPLQTKNAVSFSGLVTDGGSDVSGIGVSTADSTTVIVKRYDSAIWGLGANQKISLTGCYKSTQQY